MVHGAVHCQLRGGTSCSQVSCWPVGVLPSTVFAAAELLAGLCQAGHSSGALTFISRTICCRRTWQAGQSNLRPASEPFINVEENMHIKACLRALILRLVSSPSGHLLICARLPRRQLALWPVSSVVVVLHRHLHLHLHRGSSGSQMRTILRLRRGGTIAPQLGMCILQTATVGRHQRDSSGVCGSSLLSSMHSASLMLH